MPPRRRSTWRVVLGALGILFLLLLGAVVWLERTLPFSLADLPRLRREGRLDALNTPRGEGGVKTLTLTLDLMTPIEGEEVDLAIESLLLLTLWHDRDDLLGPRRPSFEQAAADRELPDGERLKRRPVITSMPIKMQTGSGLKPALLPSPVFDTLRPVALPKVLPGCRLEHQTLTDPDAMTVDGRIEIKVLGWEDQPLALSFTRPEPGTPPVSVHLVYADRPVTRTDLQRCESGNQVTRRDQHLELKGGWNLVGRQQVRLPDPDGGELRSTTLERVLPPGTAVTARFPRGFKP